MIILMIFLATGQTHNPPGGIRGTGQRKDEKNLREEAGASIEKGSPA